MLGFLLARAGVEVVMEKHADFFRDFGVLIVVGVTGVVINVSVPAMEITPEEVVNRTASVGSPSPLGSLRTWPTEPADKGALSD